MTLETLIPILVVGLVIVLFVMFPEFRSLFKGFIRLFIKDMATTPEGAEAIYEEKIDQARDAYARADNAYKNAAGKLSIEKQKLESLRSKLKSVESECEAFVKNNRMDYAQLKSEEREEIIADISRTEQLIKAYENAVNTAKDMHEKCERNLKKLQRESKDVVENMKVKQQLKEVYDETDDLKASTATDKLLTQIREKNSDLDAMVEGSRVVHESKLSTRLDKASSEAKKLQSNDYLESLKKKYNK